MLLQNRLLVEKFLSHIIFDYEDCFLDYEVGEDIPISVIKEAQVDLKLQFLLFLQSFNADEIEYGIEYLQNEFDDIYQILGTVIIEYRTHGIDGIMEPSDEDMEDLEIIELEESNLNVWQKLWMKIKLFFQFFNIFQK